MSRQGPAPDDLQRLRIENRQRLTVSEEEAGSRGIESQVVGVVEGDDAGDGGRPDRIVGVEAAAAATRDHEPVRSAADKQRPGARQEGQRGRRAWLSRGR
jgi:hypothetical protein